MSGEERERASPKLKITRQTANALVLSALKRRGVHEPKCPTHRVVPGRGPHWSSGDEQKCECELGAAILVAESIVMGAF